MARHLTAEQQAEADRIEQRLLELVRDDLRELAEHLASKPDDQLLGATEYEVRDRVHRIGARALEAALTGREKGGIAAPV
jgi:hypothetical protein